MKRFIFTLVALLCFTGAFAQNMKEVVYLKNGSIIKGIIIEQIPNESLKIQTADGSIFAYKMDEVTKITKEVINQNNSNDSYSNFDIRGFKVFIDIDYVLSCSYYKVGSRKYDFSDRVGGLATFGYQITNKFFVGAGAGGHYFYEGSAYTIPIFADVRFNILSKRITPFIDAKVGYSTGDWKGFYLNPTVGCHFGFGGKFGLNVGVGYLFQTLDGVDGSTGDVAFKMGVEF